MENNSLGLIRDDQVYASTFSNESDTHLHSGWPSDEGGVDDFHSADCQIGIHDQIRSESGDEVLDASVTSEAPRRVCSFH